jgi:hypothetical protein
MDFENFKSSVCHSLKSMGDLPFLLNILKSNEIQYYFANDRLLECFYLLGMVDYLCRINDLPFDGEYNYIRKYKLENLVFPAGVHVLCSVYGNDGPKEEFLKKAIPEFLRYNIVESGIRDVA